MKFPQPNNLKEAILWTLAWFDLYHQPLTASEVHRWLFGFKANYPEVELALNEHISVAKETYQGKDYYMLRGRKNLVPLRLRREKTAEKFWQKVEKYKTTFARLPHIKMVAVGNTLAFGYPEHDSDIDLLVVTSKNRLWSARLNITSALHLRGVRRHADKVAGRFCLSFFTTEDNLNFENILKKPFDPYLAQWILTLTPIFDESDFAPRFWSENFWAYNYFPNFKLQTPTTPKKRTGLDNFITKIRELTHNSLYEKSVKKFLLPRTQKKYKQLPKNHDTIISDNMLKFHESDARRELYKKWKKILKEIDQTATSNLK